MKLKTLCVTAITCLTISTAALAKEYVVDDVTDGDTIRVLSDSGKKLRIRFYGIDAPESTHDGKRGQSYGNEAQRFLSSMIIDDRVELDIYGTDRYGRSIATIY